MPDPERDEPSLELELPRLRRRKRTSRKPSEETAAEPTPVSGAQSTEPPAQTVKDPPPLTPAAAGASVVTEQTAVLEVPEVAEAPPVADAPPPVRQAPRERRELPSVNLPSGWPAVVVTGLVVGLVVVALTWASLRTCEAVQGTSTCGRAGYPMLLVVLALAVIVGSTLLRLTQVPDPVSTSLLGLGVAAVIALVFLIDHLDSIAMVVVIPVVCAATFAGSHWLTTRVIEPDRD